MCNPKQSSLIAKDEDFILQPINDDTIETITKMVLENQYNMQELYLSGGEPFYIPHNVRLLKRIENKDIHMRINTNMQWIENNPLLKVLLDYKNVLLTMSADAVGEQFEYIRNGSKWKLFADNIEYIKSKTNFDLRVNTIFSIINADRICDLIEYFYFDQGIQDITINLLYQPEPLDARNYPQSKKQAIVTRLTEMKERIGIANRNLSNNIQNCIMQIQLPNQHEYEASMDRLTMKHPKNWRKVFTDLV